MNSYKQTIGRLGEEVAMRYLQDKGHDVVKTNYKNRYGEIDIITQDGEYTVFVEVKTRTSINYGNPSEAVNFYKKKHMKKCAQYYLYPDKYETAMRFDIVEIIGYMSGGDLKITNINHIENAIC